MRYPDDTPEEELTQADRDIFKHYASVFRNHSGHLVLAHLAKICGAKFTKETYDNAENICPIKMAMREGMRRVYWKIQHFIEMSDMMPPEEKEGTIGPETV